MTVHQRIFAALRDLALFGLTVELVRRRKLQEEFSLLWPATGAERAANGEGPRDA